MQSQSMMQVQKELIVYKCPFRNCDRVFKSKFELEEHECEKHGMAMKCGYVGCSASFKNKLELLAHIEDVHGR